MVEKFDYVLEINLWRRSLWNLFDKYFAYFWSENYF